MARFWWDSPVAGNAGRTKGHDDEAYYVLPEPIRQRLIVLARKYYAGQQKVLMTRRQQEYLDLHGDAEVDFSFNYCKTIINAVVEKLRVQGFKTGSETLQNQLWEWWNINRMDAKQNDIHRYTGRDGECFIMVDWNVEEQYPEFILHPRYTGKENRGDDYGVYFVYPNNDFLLKPSFAVKHFEDLDEKGMPRKRRTTYYPDMIKKECFKNGKWVGLSDPGDTEWPIPFRTNDGKPLGIPFAHIANPDCLSDLRDVISWQDAVNKTWLDVMAVADSEGFRTTFTFGFRPTLDGKEPSSDGSNLIRVAPGNIVSTTKPPNQASVVVVDPGDITGMLNLEDRLLQRVSSLSNIPISRFQTSHLIASDQTLQEEEAPLLSKVEERQTLYGNGYEDLMKIAVLHANEFGGMGLEVRKDIEINWKNPEVRSAGTQVDLAAKKQVLGIPSDLWLADMYSPEVIETIKNNPEFQLKMKLMQEAMQNAVDMTNRVQNGGRPGMFNQNAVKANGNGNSGGQQ